MKKYCWLFLGTLVATAAMAQVNTNSLLAVPAPTLHPAVTPVAPAAVKPKKKVVTKPVVKPATKVSEPSAPLVPGAATVAVDHLNLRGQAGLKGEVVGHLKKGDAVTVLSHINLDKPAADEPAQWAKIALPSGTKVWLNGQFIDAKDKTVSAKKLNLRGGPGENFSVLGVLEKGTSITEITNKGGWMQIEAPASAFAFVAANYLKQETPAIATAIPTPTVATTVEALPPTASTVTEPQPITAQPPIAMTTMPPIIIQTNIIQTNIIVMAETNVPPPPRIVTHEGNVRFSVSPVAPTYFELFDPTTGNAINYLFSTTTNLNLTRYNGLKIVVTGEEGLDARWKDTPVLTVQKIYVVPSGTNAPAKKSNWLW